MNYFNNLKIGTRLVLAFSLLVLLIVLVGLQSVIKAKSVQSGLEDITERRMLIVAEANDLRLEVNRQARSIRNIALLATTTVLAACASPAPQYYRLPHSDYRLPSTPPNAVLQQRHQNALCHEILGRCR